MKTTQADTLVIRADDLLKASFLFEALIHPMRQCIFQLLLEQGGLAATALAQKLDIEQGLCLQQLSILSGVGLVRRQTVDEQSLYVVDHEKLDALYSAAEALLVRP